MSVNSDVSIVHNNQLYSIPITAATTFSFLLHRAHQLFNIQPDAACPFQLTNSAGVSFDKLGDSSVLGCVKDDRRLMFGPREPPVKRTLTQLLQSVHVNQTELSEQREDEDDSSSDDDDDGQDDDDGDKENRQQDGRQTPQTAAAARDAAASPSAAAALLSVSLPASSSPIQSQLWRIFTFYCLQGVKAASSSCTSSSPSSSAVSPFESLSSSNWVRLLEDCLVVNSVTAAASASSASSSCVPLSRHQAELLHLTVSKRTGRFSYEAFVPSLCKVGVTAYRHQLQPSAALSSLLLQHILPMAQRDNPLQHAPLLSHPALAGVITAFSAFISAAFSAYAGASSSSNPEFLSFAAYSQWLSDCKLTRLVPAAETSRCFVLSLDDEEEMRADGCRLRLSRAGFQQCVGRLILQGLGRKQPVNASLAKALFTHCQSNLSLQHRLLKATPADRKALERMQRSLDAACQLLVKQDGKRDYLQAAAAITAALPQPPPLTVFQQQPWQQLMARDAAFAAVAASLSVQTDADTGRAGAAARLSAGRAARRPAAVKIALSASKPTSSGKKAGKSVRPAAADAAVDASALFGSPKTPRVVALVPRTPAAKKSGDSRQPAQPDSEEEEDDDHEGEEEEQRRAAEERERQAQAEREQRAQREAEEVKAREQEARLQEARLQEEKRREDEERRQEQARLVRQQQEEANAEKARARQREEAEREDRWQREKEAEVARVREKERQERERKEEQMQREIQQLREALAAQQQHKRRSSSKPRPAAAAAVAGSAAQPSPGLESQPKANEESKSAITSSVQHDAVPAAPPVAVVSPSAQTASSSSASRAAESVTAAAARRPSAGIQLSAPSVVSVPAAPILQERPLPTTLLPAKLPSQRLSLTAAAEQRRSSGRAEAKAEPVKREEEFKVEQAAAQQVEEEEQSSEDDSESEEEETKEDPRRLMFHASMSQPDSSDDDDDDDDDDSSGQHREAEAAVEDDSEEEEEGDSEDEQVGPLTVAIDCSYSVNQSRPSLLALDAGDAEDGELQAAMDNSLTNITRTIHSINVSHSQSHELPSQQQPAVPAAPAVSASEEEEEELSGPAVYPAPFDSALHEERLRALQAELKEVLAARRRLQRRTSYMEEVEDKRLQEELKAKQRAILQLKMLRAKQERERAKAEEEQERARRRAAEAEEAEAQQRLQAEEAERQREQAEQERKAKAEHEERWRKARLQAEAERRAQQQQQEQLAAASPPTPPSVPSASSSLLSSSLIRAVESGDTFLRYYSGWWRKPKSKFVRVSHSSLRVYWGRDCYHLSKWIEIAQVQQVREASQSSAASRLPVDLLGQALTIECDDGKRSLHLVATNHATREVWKRYLEAVLALRK